MYISDEEKFKVVEMLIKKATKKEIKKYLGIGDKGLSNFVEDQERWFKDLYYSRFPKSHTKSMALIEEEKPITKKEFLLAMNRFSDNIKESHTKSTALENNINHTKSMASYEDIELNELPLHMPKELVEDKEIKKITLKIGKDISEKFNEYCKNHKKQYNKQTILSYIIYEFLRKNV